MPVGTAPATNIVGRTFTKPKRQAGIAGQYGYSTVVTYEDSEPMVLSFVGSEYGEPGPIVMVMGAVQTFVSDPGRFGPKLSEAWVEAFVSAS